MKFNGQSLSKPFTHVFQLPRGTGEPLQLTLCPLSLGFHQRLRERGIEPPQPPLKVARDSAGKPIRDAQGMAITHFDRTHPEYLDQLERYHQRVAVLSVVESLQQDPTITFESVPPAEDSPNGWAAYADNVFQELEQAGFTAGDLILLCREICRLSNLLGDHLGRSRENFSSAGQTSPP